MRKLVALALSAVAVVAIAMLAAFTPPLGGITDGVAALNDAGDHVYASAVVADTTGVTTTVATAGTYVTVGTAAPLAAGESDGSGCITYTLATNRFTVALRCGVGELRLRACIADGVGTLSKTWTGAWHRIRSGTTTLTGPIMRRTEAATALRESHGCVETIVDANLADTYEFRYDSSANADTVVTRHAFWTVEKVLNK